MDLKPLQCPGCGGVVPLGEGHSYPCPFCRHEISIPQNYVDWRQGKEDKLRAEEQVLSLHQELGKTPRRWEIWLSKIKGGCGCGGCLFFYLTMVLGGVLLRLVYSAMEALFPPGSVQVDPDGGVPIMFTVLAVLLILGPYMISTLSIALGVLYIRRKVFTLATLQGKLMASPPVLEGGPSTCRGCGGPLDVQPGQLCSPCFYCGSQNLVALEPEWYARLKADTTQSRETFAEAMAVYRETTSKAKKRLMGYGAIFTVFGLLFFQAFSSQQEERWPPVGFDEFVKERRVLTPNRSLQFFLDQPISFDFYDTNLQARGKGRQNKGVYFLIPLNEGEELTIKLDEREVPALLKVVAENDSKRMLENKKLEWVPLVDRPAVVTADRKSWYGISIAPAQTVESAPYTVEFEVAGRRRQKKALDLTWVSIGSVFLNMEPKSTPLPIKDSDWSLLGKVEVQLDKKGRVERIRGPVLNAPKAPEANGPGRIWLDTFTPSQTTPVYQPDSPSGFKLFWQHTYLTPETVLKVKEKDGELLGFELSRGKDNDAETVSGLSADGSFLTLEQRPDPATATLINGFIFDQKEGFNVYGIAPGTSRQAAEKLLGKPSKEWGRYAHYGAETVCYWNGKVRWIRSPILSQGRRMVKFAGPSHALDESLGERFLRIDLRSQPRGLPSLSCRGEFYRFGNDVLVLYSSNSEVISGAVISGSLFPQSEESPMTVKDGQATMGSFSLKENSQDPDPLFSFFGQEHLHYLFEHSSAQRDLLENFAEESDERSFQYNIWAPGPKLLIEYWKQHFNKVRKP